MSSVSSRLRFRPRPRLRVTPKAAAVLAWLRVHRSGEVVTVCAPPISSTVEARHSADRSPHRSETRFARLDVTQHELATMRDLSVQCLHDLSALGWCTHIHRRPGANAKGR